MANVIKITTNQTVMHALNGVYILLKNELLMIVFGEGREN